MNYKVCSWFSELTINDVSRVGGKNASLGEMIQCLQPFGINVPNGFATEASAFRHFLDSNSLSVKLQQLMLQLDTKQYSNLNQISTEAKQLVLSTSLSDELKISITNFYHELCEMLGREVDVAVRSSATAEDLPTASFAGQHDSFLNIRGAENVIGAVHRCFASLYNARAIKYRIDNGFQHDQVALSAGIQEMVRSDLSSAGVCFTIEPESGFKNVVVITGCWGLGENIVQGAVTPDEFHVFKPSIINNKKAILSKKLGSKLKSLVYSGTGSKLENIDTPIEKQQQWVLNDDEILTIGKWCIQIERHYKMPMDIEWAKDGITNKLFIVQARPETVHSIKDPYVSKEYHLLDKGKVIISGNAVGSGIATGIARILTSPTEAHKLMEGEILVTEITNPDWDPILKKASAIITAKGGRTSHAAIVARELGAVAIVGAQGAMQLISDGQPITVSTSQGKTGFVYDGILRWKSVEHDFRHVQLPRTLPMLILADPDKAYKFSFYPNAGVGLMRMEFIINNTIQIHPMALVHYPSLASKDDISNIDKITFQYHDKREYFIDKLSQAIATIAAAFHPKDVIVRMSDFKSNEYANLIGGKEFEPQEENPMIGFRGASRYYHPRYKEGFRLECEAMKKVRDEMGLTNVKLMIPFCRTVEEGRKVLSLMEEFSLKKGVNGLEIYVMVEIPSNIISADAFAEVFDGFSIGSNDLTQLTLGIDRDSTIISELFDENNPAVKWMIGQVIKVAKEKGVKIGLCGQAPSDNPSFAKFLIQEGIHSISFNPDALLKGIENMLVAEEGN